MTGRAAAEIALFSVKCFVAAMLAYYIALRIGLTRPYWAVTTSYIVAQPLAGAVLSKAVFRVAGTVLGAAAAVVLVPNLVNAPELLSLALALWLGVCLYISMQDRTPRAYVFLLAGYTASIIGLPSVAAPGAIFDTAILRVQEIIIGILCGSLIHGAVFPRTVTAKLLERIEAILADVERWSHNSLQGAADASLDHDRRRLALDINELHQLSTHLPFDTARFLPRVRTVRALQDQLSMLLPLGSAVEDRLTVLRGDAGGVPPEVAALIERVCDWLASAPLTPADRAIVTDRLIADARALEPDGTAPLTWRDALLMSLLGRLADLIAAHRGTRDLRDQIRSPTRAPVSPVAAAALRQAGRRAFHRDRQSAIRAAFGTIATILIGCAFWIGTAWADGAGAVLIAGVCCALFGNSDDPAPAIRLFLYGSIVGILIAAPFAFGIMPRLTDFVTLAMAMAPILLVAGALLANPKTSLLALGGLLGFINIVGLGDRYNGEFLPFINGAIAQIAGTFFAVITVGLFQTVGTEQSAARLIRAGWRDLARRSDLRTAPDATGWNSRMLDRIGLLAPRLAAKGQDPGRPVLDALQDLRVGLTVGELRRLRMASTAPEDAIISPVLGGVGRHYAALRTDRVLPNDDALLASIDRAMAGFARDESAAARRDGLLALTGLRRNLFPSAPVFVDTEAT
ncbi:MAG: Fusaric acid resistance protein [Sphingomonas bacterium]|nr:Fusaric acid resistance protein [Sphingomonas bacterium]